MLLLPTFLAGWAPALHWNCAVVNRVAEGVVYVPVVLVNSPFGGKAWANGTVPSYFPGSLGYPTRSSFQSSFAQNGTATGTFNTVNVSVYQVASQLTLGPGSNLRCSQSLLVTLSKPPYLGTYAGWSVGLPSNRSDKGEAPSVLFAAYGD